MTIKEEIAHEASKGARPNVGKTVGWYSLIFGSFLLIYGDYLHGIFSKLFDVMPGWVLAGTLIISALVKLVGLYTKNRKLMQVGIVSLSAVWTGLTAVYLVYSFGIGYPSPSFLSMGLVMVTCYQEARKGDFG